MPAPTVGAVVDGYRFKGGNPNDRGAWEQVGPRAAPAWGSGAVELPDKSVVRYGPRGGVTVLKKASAGQGSIEEPITMTEDQGKAQVQARLMADAEGSYQQARRQGYDPASLKNSFASYIEGFPIIDGLGSVIRDDVSDRGRQAELQYSDAQLKAMSGAAAPEPEVKRNVKILFPRPGENIDQIEAQKQAARMEAFRGAKLRSGPAGPTLPVYPGDVGSSPRKPIDLSKGQSRSTIPKGAFYRDPEGNIRRNDHGDDGNPIIQPAKTGAAPQAGPQRLRYNPATGEIE